MAELLIQTAGDDLRVIPLEPGSLVLGRGDDCDIQVLEKMASRRHLRITCPDKDDPLAGGVVIDELGSSNGTWFGEQRIARKLCYPGDALRIGETTLRLRGAPPAVGDDVPLVSGSLDLVDLGPAASAFVMEPKVTPQPASAPPSSKAPRSPQTTPARTWRRSDTDAVMRSAAIVLIGLGALLGVNYFLGNKAQVEEKRAAAERESRRVMETVAQGDAQAFAKRVADFRAKYPESPANLALAKARDELKERELDQRKWLDEAALLAQRIGKRKSTEQRHELHRLAARSDFDVLQRRVDFMLRDLTSRRERSDEECLGSLREHVTSLLAEGMPGRALALVRSFESLRPGLATETRETLSALKQEAKNATDAAHNHALDAESKAKSTDEKASHLATAWRALVGSTYEEDIASRMRALAVMRIRTARPPVASRTGSSPKGRTATGDTPRFPAGSPTGLDGPRPGGFGPGADDPLRPSAEDEAILRESLKAEALMRERKWETARAVLTTLVEKTGNGLLKTEWQARIADADRLLLLADRLAARAATDKPVSKKLSLGRTRITGATRTGVSLVIGTGKSEPQSLAYGELEDEDLFALLATRSGDTATALSVATLAAELGRSNDVVSALKPLYKGERDLDAANALVARHIYGQHTVPDGGYTLYKDELLDSAAHAEVLRQERIAELRQEAARLVGAMADLPSFRKLKKVRQLRQKLDKARRYALLAIFNEKHYPYPANKSSTSYQTVQREVNRRVDLVRTIWNTNVSVTIRRKGRVKKILDAWDKILTELESLGHSKKKVKKIRKSMAPFAVYVKNQPITVRNFFYTAKERQIREYNHWVMTQYNPARDEYATVPERDQVAITNRYRMMMGFAATVSPGGADVSAIDDKSVVKILDDGHIDAITPLYAVRIDNRLVQAARDHSIDMSRRGYFSHHSEPNPATGEGSVDPFTRMGRAGYPNGGSENIAQSPVAQQAHDMWVQSSGHHRNILSDWTDLGSGVGGRNFTQNFGYGGGNLRTIQPTTKNLGPRKGAVTR